MDDNTQQLIREIEQEVFATSYLTGKDELDPRVISAIAKTPRDQFIADDLQHRAFDNKPLSIGYGQTISQPYIVALMTDLLSIQPHHKILEIGTGSGYQAAILSRLCTKAYTVERISELGKLAQTRFKKLHYENINTLIGNGYLGWPEHAPYDGIIVTAAAAQVPPALIEQLKPGGQLIIPVGLDRYHQDLLKLQKDQHNNVQTRSIIGVIFVPLVDDA